MCIIFFPIDLDECSLNIDKCAHGCVNTIGSYACYCDAGYKLGSNGLQCDGKNTCTLTAILSWLSLYSNLNVCYLQYRHYS